MAAKRYSAQILLVALLESTALYSATGSSSIADASWGAGMKLQSSSERHAHREGGVGLLRLRGGDGASLRGAGRPQRFVSGRLSKETGRGGFNLAVLVPLGAVLMKKALGFALGLLLLGIDR